MTDRPKPEDVRAINPRYKGAKLGDMARALLRPLKAPDPSLRRRAEKERRER